MLLVPFTALNPPALVTIESRPRPTAPGTGKPTPPAPTADQCAWDLYNCELDYWMCITKAKYIWTATKCRLDWDVCIINAGDSCDW